MTNVIFYRKSNGECPFIEYLNSLSTKLRVKTLRSIMLLEEFGTDLRMPFSCAVRDDIFELRSIVGTDITRAMYFFAVSNTAIITHGFTKKTQKTPVQEIERAKRYKDDYCLRNSRKD